MKRSKTLYICQIAKKKQACDQFSTLYASPTGVEYRYQLQNFTCFNQYRKPFWVLSLFKIKRFGINHSWDSYHRKYKKYGIILHKKSDSIQVQTLTNRWCRYMRKGKCHVAELLRNTNSVPPQLLLYTDLPRQKADNELNCRLVSPFSCPETPNTGLFAQY